MDCDINGSVTGGEGVAPYQEPQSPPAPILVNGKDPPAVGHLTSKYVYNIDLIMSAVTCNDPIVPVFNKFMLWG